MWLCCPLVVVTGMALALFIRQRLFIILPVLLKMVANHVSAQKKKNISFGNKTNLFSARDCEVNPTNIQR